ncbi:hypothetical protein ES703_79162 [subsurface metagenome]
MYHQPGHGKEETGNHAVAEHLQNRPGQAHLAQGKDAQQHIAHVADAAVCNQPLDVRLPQRYRRPVDHADDRQYYQQMGKMPGDIREHADTQSYHPVAAHLDE